MKRKKQDRGVVINTVPNTVYGGPTEYFCHACGQGRLCFIADNKICRNCGSEKIVRGLVGSLNMESLRAEYDVLHG